MTSFQRTVYYTMDHGDPKQVALWAALDVGWWLLLRKSNLVPDSLDSFNPDRQLVRGDFDIYNQLIMVSLRWTKTIQNKSEVLKVPLIRAKKSPLCPVKAVRNMVSMIPAHPHSAAFSVPRGRQLVPITYPALNRFIKHKVALLGYDPSRFSSHSIRRGACSYMAECNIRQELIRTVGTWKSDCYMRYIDWAMKSRVEAAQAMADHL